MRKHYNPERGLELVRRYPNNARLIEGPASSSPTAKGRGVRHHLSARGFTPVRVEDMVRFAAAREDLSRLVAVSRERQDLEARKKIAKRAGRTVQCPTAWWWEQGWERTSVGWGKSGCVR